VPGIYLAGVVVLVASALAGRLVLRAAGFATARWWGPAAGLALLLAVAGTAIRLPGHASTAAAGVLVVAVAGAFAGPRGAVRRAELPAAGVLTALLALLAASLPYLVSGRAGIPGTGDNDDMSAHLATAWWLGAHAGAAPVAAIGGALATAGYPVGPHALAAALSAGLPVSLVGSFDGLMLAFPPLLALAALGALPRRAPAPLRICAALLVGLCYLGASYLVEGAFKELAAGMLLAAFVLALRDVVVADGRPRRGIALGVIAAGLVYDYSYPGLVWPLAVAAVCAAVALTRRRLVLGAVLRAGAAAAGACLVLVAPELDRVSTFSGSFFAHEPADGLGNLVHGLSPLEAVGVWFSGDFRFDPEPRALSLAIAWIAAGAVAAALVWWLRRRDPVIAAAWVAAALLAVLSDATRSPYATAKALAILAPLSALLVVSAFVTARPQAAGRRRLLSIAALGLALAAGASSLLALRDGPVGPTGHERDLGALRPALAGRAVLFLGKDDFAQWELRGARLAIGPYLYAPSVAPLAPGVELHGQALQFDDFTAATLDRYDDVVQPAGAYRAPPPPNFTLAARTPTYLLWRRAGSTPVTVGVGRVLRCASSPADRALSRRRGVATVAAAPVLADPAAWRGQPRAAGQEGRLTLRVPAGTWDVSLQYASDTGLDVSAPGLHATVPANLERIGPFWPAGILARPQAGTVTIRARARDATPLARLLGAAAATEGPALQGGTPVSGLALTRHGERAISVPLAAACGRYVYRYRAA
jgi:hypothetical protein